MRSKAITFRVEPETARALTWLVNNYNLDNCESRTKTDLLEGLITVALEDEDIVKRAMRRVSNVKSKSGEAKA